MYYTGATYSLLFDFSPNSLPEEQLPDYGHAADAVLTKYYNLLFSEMALNSLPNTKREALNASGYFVCPAIMPYPFTVLCDPNKEIQDFVSALQRHYSSAHLRTMVVSWASTLGWKDRVDLFLETIDNIDDYRFRSAIAMLIPQLEGTLRDGIHILYQNDSRMNPQAALAFLSKKMEEKDLPNITKAYLSSLSEYFSGTSGLFVSFKNWTDDLSSSFISRHAVSHGKNVPEMYTRANCVRLFLILSTIHDICSALSGNECSILPK